MFPSDKSDDTQPIETPEFIKIEQSKCTLALNGETHDAPGACNLVTEPSIKESKTVDSKKIHNDNKVYYSSKFDAVTPEKDILIKISQTYGFPDTTLYFQMIVEGRGNAHAIKNDAGAKGYFQFLDGTAKEFGLITKDRDYRTNPYASADAAARYMLWIGQHLYGSDVDVSSIDVLTHILAAYNAGHRRVYVNGEIKMPKFYETIRYTQNIIDLIEGNATLIEPNENLSKISLRTGVPIEVLLESNFGIDSDKDLMAYEVLQLPLGGISKVIVRKGMSLYSIQNGTGVKVEQIKKLNRMVSDVIHPCDVILIPTSMYQSSPSKELASI
jgi:LysM repeat protein